MELVNSKNDVIAKQVINITNNKWQKLTATLTSPQTDAKGLMRVYLEKGSESVDLDHISLFPEDNWNGLRADLVQDLADLKPGIFRFPGGCIVEGTDLDTRYEWKNSVGAPENRPLNENRWRDTFHIAFSLTTISHWAWASMSISSFQRRLVLSHCLFSL